jgi:hypothetical protein
MRNILFASVALIGLATALPAFAAVDSGSVGVTLAQGEAAGSNTRGVNGPSQTFAQGEAAGSSTRGVNGPSVTLAAGEAINHNPAEYPQQGYQA